MEIVLLLAAGMGYYLWSKRHFEIKNGLRVVRSSSVKDVIAAFNGAGIQGVPTPFVGAKATAFQLVKATPTGVPAGSLLPSAKLNGFLVMVDENIFKVTTSAEPVTALVLIARDMKAALEITGASSQFAVVDPADLPAVQPARIAPKK